MKKVLSIIMILNIVGIMILTIGIVMGYLPFKEMSHTLMINISSMCGIYYWKKYVLKNSVSL